MVAEISLSDSYTVPTRHWHRLDDGRIQCDVCPRACRLHEGQRGPCFVRGRINDQVVMTSSGRSSRFCVDPIERKPLNAGAAVIDRDWHAIGRYELTHDGRCTRCGNIIPGRFDGPVGNWGRRRQPVSLISPR